MIEPIKQKRMKAVLRAKRVRLNIKGTVISPRMSVKRSLKHVYVQLIDDVNGKTIASASDKDVTEKGKPVEVARTVGKIIAQKAVAIGIKKVIFDRGSYRYHGQVAAVADGAREGGLII